MGALLIATLALVVPSASARTIIERPASPRFHAIPGAAFESVSVGHRYVVFRLDGRAAIRVVDGRTRRWRDVTLPAGCGSSIGLRDPLILVPCADRTALLVDAKTGEATRVPQISDTEGYWQLGRRWMRTFGGCVAEAGTCSLYRNLVTGEERTVTTLPGETFPDLDDDALRPVSICAPYERLGRGRTVSGLTWRGSLVTIPSGGRLSLGRCGTTRVKTIGPSRREVRRFTGPFGGWVAWTATDCRRGLRGYTYDIAKQVRYRVSLSKRRVPRPCGSTLEKTDDALVLVESAGSTGDSSEEDFLYRVSIAKRPG